MICCYAEKTKDGKIDHIVVQDETGVYDYILNDDRNGGKFIPTHFLEYASIKMPGEKPKKVMTNTKEFLEFIRQCERGDYTVTIPTEIREYSGTKEEIIKAAMRDFKLLH